MSFSKDSPRGLVGNCFLPDGQIETIILRVQEKETRFPEENGFLFLSIKKVLNPA